MVEEAVVAMGTQATWTAHKVIGVDRAEATQNTTGQFLVLKVLKPLMVRRTPELQSMATLVVQWCISHHKPVRVEVVLAPREAMSLNIKSEVPVEMESLATSLEHRHFMQPAVEVLTEVGEELPVDLV
jgi:hypothetical protein